MANRSPRLIAKYYDFRFDEFTFYITKALKDDPAGDGGVTDLNLFNAIGHASTLWSAALRLTAAQREALLAFRAENR